MTDDPRLPALAGNSGPGGRERSTVAVNTVMTPTMKYDLGQWANRRGLSLSAAVKALIADALVKDPQVPRRAMYQPLGTPPPSEGSSPSESNVRPV